MNPVWQQRLPLLVTSAVFVALYLAAAVLYDGFFSPWVFTGLLTDNATLGIAAVGLTLVIFSGGIDLSVGAVVGFTSILTAVLVENGWHPATAALLALVIGVAFGGSMGAVIEHFNQPPFLITLAGMFFMRGLAYWITTESTEIAHPAFQDLAVFEVAFSDDFILTTTSLGLIAALIAGIIVAHYTRFGRNLLAMGGSEQSALLMGLPIGASKIGVYAVSGGCAALAGLAATVYTGAGNPALGIGLELDAIAVVVIGGTLLTGGRGHMFGTVLGVLIFGTIQSAILFDGRLNSWWIRIVVGGLLLGFILVQRLFLTRISRA